MIYSFDIFGWYSVEQIPGRFTEIEPPLHGEKVDGELYPNFTGHEWVILSYYNQEFPINDPPSPPKPDTITVFTKFQFISRFTIDERLAIYAAEATTSIIRLWLDTFRICEEIDIANPDTVAGIMMLQSLGFITELRASEILAV